ncbi:MAG: ribosome assembly cofactor RimP [Bacteroidales bacterium]|jgi:ribosome maturation factor RimP|nr:ribosome assembly cofactor RimP [Bacteroidales bacterium]
MIDKDKLTKVVEEYLKDGEIFLVGIKISKDNKVSVIIDGDNGVLLQDCIDLSKHIEKNFDRDKEDFLLSVLSSGVGEPLVLKRQYKKNVGRRISIKTIDEETIEGKLLEVGEDNILIQTKKKTKDKGEKAEGLSFENIKEAKILITI